MKTLHVLLAALLLASVASPGQAGMMPMDHPQVKSLFNILHIEPCSEIIEPPCNMPCMRRQGWDRGFCMNQYEKTLLLCSCDDQFLVRQAAIRQQQENL